MFDGKPWSYSDEKKIAAESRRKYLEKKQKVNDAFQGMLCEVFGCVVTLLLVLTTVLMWGAHEKDTPINIFYWMLGIMAFTSMVWISGHKQRVNNQ